MSPVPIFTLPARADEAFPEPEVGAAATDATGAAVTPAVGTRSVGQAQAVRASKRDADNAFWGRYKNFASTAEAYCNR